MTTVNAHVDIEETQKEVFGVSRYSVEIVVTRTIANVHVDIEETQKEVFGVSRCSVETADTALGVETHKEEELSGAVLYSHTQINPGHLLGEETYLEETLVLRDIGTRIRPLQLDGLQKWKGLTQLSL